MICHFNDLCFTLLTDCIYLLLFAVTQYINHSPEKSRRGFGIDCAILSCQVSVYFNCTCIYYYVIISITISVIEFE